MNAAQRRHERRLILRFRSGMPFKKPVTGWTVWQLRFYHAEIQLDRATDCTARAEAMEALSKLEAAYDKERKTPPKDEER